MLLNKLPCLDKGYVALLDSANDSQKLNDIRAEFLSHLTDYSKLMFTGSMTLVLKCPIFVQVHLSQFGFTIAHTRPSNDIEAYIPNVGEIGCPDLETSGLIADDIYRTTDALLLNPKAYQTDGCNRFISQILMPISTYTTIIVHGGAENWKKFITQTDLPSPIESYRAVVEQIHKAEWK